jgi:hypothetical protein
MMLSRLSTHRLELNGEHEVERLRGLLTANVA